MLKKLKKVRPAAMKEFIDSTKNKLFDISASPIVFRCEEDRIFFEDQKNDRKFLIGSLDEEDTRKINENIARRQRDRRTREENSEEYSRPGPSRTPIVSEDEEEIHVAKRPRRDVDGDWAPPSLSQRHQRRLQEGSVSLSVDRTQWLDRVAIAADKNLISGRKALQTAIAGVAGDSSSIGSMKFSHSTLYRRQKKMRTKVAEIVKDRLDDEINNDDKFILHWDEKLLKGRRHVDKSLEYMAIVLRNVMTGEIYLI